MAKWLRRLKFTEMTKIPNFELKKTVKKSINKSILKFFWVFF